MDKHSFSTNKQSFSPNKKYSLAIFLDTSFFKAIFDDKDDFYQQAKEIWNKIKEEETLTVTSNYILDETFTLLKKRSGPQIVIKFRDDLAVSKNISVIRVIHDDEAKAWNWFLKDWSDLSFTDCVSFAVMERLGIKKAATFDEHFSRAGFRVV